VEKEQSDDLSWYRASLCKDIMERIYSRAGWTCLKTGEADLKLLLTLNSLPTKGNENTEQKRVVIGVVRNVESKQKEVDIGVEQFLR
jgi:hypothetical protein